MTSSRKWIGRLLVVGALGATVAFVGAPTASDSPVVMAQTGLGAGGEFHPLPPKRIFDSRNGVNDTAPRGVKPTSDTGASFEVDILGVGGVPAEVAGTNRDVLAVVANVTVVGAGAPGYLSIRPSGAAPAETSLVNFEPGEAVPNLAVLAAGAGGRVTVTLTTPNRSSSAHVLVDVFGWISTSSFADTADTGTRFVPVGPSRILDTRSVPVPRGWSSGTPIGTMQQVTLPIRGANGLIPARPGVTGVMINVTAVNSQPGSVPTYLSVTPAATPPGTEPATSITNVSPGQVKANMAIVPVGSDGSIRIFNRSGQTHVIVDVLGYLEQGGSSTTQAGRLIPLDAPFRAFDTRQGAFGGAPLGAGGKERWSFRAFAESVSLNGVPLGAQSALVGNLTGTGLTSHDGGSQISTFLTVYPGGGNPPNSSNINVTVGRSVPNMSLIRFGSEGGDPYTISAYNFDGGLHYLLDVYAVVLAD